MEKGIVDRLQSALTEVSPVMGGAVDKMRDLHLEWWEEDLIETLTKLFPSAENLARAARAYTRFAMEVSMHQHKFNRIGRYQCSNFKEVAGNVYYNTAFMADTYLPAVLLSHYLWPHHYKQQLFFRQAFLPLIKNFKAPSFCEVGLGSGLYSRLTLSECRRAVGDGYDISEAAVAFARDHITVFGLHDRWKGMVQDIETAPSEKKYTHAICVEVLEHLEDPQSLLSTLHTRLVPGGRAFIVAAVTAAEYDHIYLYSTPEDVQNHLEITGFLIDTAKVFTAPGYQDHHLPPRLAGFIAKRR